MDKQLFCGWLDLAVVDEINFKRSQKFGVAFFIFFFQQLKVRVYILQMIVFCGDLIKIPEKPELLVFIGNMLLASADFRLYPHRAQP